MLLALVAAGDTVYLKSGKKLRGRVIAEDPEVVVNIYNSTFQEMTLDVQRVPKEKVKKIVRTLPAPRHEFQGRLAEVFRLLRGAEADRRMARDLAESVEDADTSYNDEAAALSWYERAFEAGSDDVHLDLGQLLSSNDSSEERRRIEQIKLTSLLGFCETTRCRRQVLLSYFGENCGEGCGNCDTCLEPVESWDGTTEAQMALSAVYRTGQRFGQGHVIDVLLGTTTSKVASWGHDRLSTFGVGGDLDRRTFGPQPGSPGSRLSPAGSAGIGQVSRRGLGNAQR